MELSSEPQLSATLKKGATVEAALNDVILGEEQLLASHPLLIAYEVEELSSEGGSEVILSTGESCTHRMKARDTLQVMGCCPFEFSYTVKARIAWNEDHSECSVRSEALALFGVMTRSEYQIQKVGETVVVKEFFSVISCPFYIPKDSVERQGLAAHTKVFEDLTEKYAA